MKRTSLTHILVDRIVYDLFHVKQTQVMPFFTLKLSQEIGSQVLFVVKLYVSSTNLFCLNHFRFVCECVHRLVIAYK